MEITDTESSDNDNSHTNRYGRKKTERWHIPKLVPSLKDMEKVPIHRSHRISQMQKKQQQVIILNNSIHYEYSQTKKISFYVFEYL